MDRAALVVSLLALMTAACFGAEDPTVARAPAPAPAAGTGAAGSPATPEAAGKEKATDTDAPRSVSFVLHNRSTETVSVLKDIQQTPLWLEIDGGVLLNGYGQKWCGGESWSHNDPAFTLEPIAADGTHEVTWRDAEQVSFSGDCWSFAPIAPGKHTARACSYAAAASLGKITSIPAGPGPFLPASKWFETAPARCTDFAFDLPASGAATIDVDL